MDIILTKLDVHGDRLLSIPNWDSIPNGSVLTKKNDTTLEFVEAIGDETIGLQTVKSITVVNGIITGKGDAITPIANGTITLSAISALTTVNGIITGTTPA